MKHYGPTRRDQQRHFEKVIRENMGLVGMIVSKHRKGVTASVGYDDLLQEGILGMMKATTRFNPYRGFKFSTYAMHWIRHYVMRAVQNQSRTVRVPVHRQAKSFREGRGQPAVFYSTDAPPGPDGDGCWLDLMPSDTELPGDALLRQSARDEVRKLVGCLDERTQQIVWARYDGLTLAEVGAIHDVSRERIRQILADAHSILRSKVQR